MKLNKEQTKEYISLQLPIVKLELQQANNKLNSIIGFIGIGIALSTSFIIFFAIHLSENIFYKLSFSLFLILLLLFLIRLIRILKSLKPMRNIKEKNIHKKIDIYNFYDISEVSSKSFLSNFTVEGHYKEALLQIHINSVITALRYKKASQII